MPAGHQVTSSTAFQIPPQPETAALRDPHPAFQAIINPKRGMEGPPQLQTPQPPGTCGSPGPAGRPCWSVDVKVVVFLVTLAGAVILLLLYRMLQLRHRLRLARAQHALEYCSFYHAATYTLKHPASYEVLPSKDRTGPESPPPIQTVTAATPAPLPPAPAPLLPPFPPPPVLPTPPLQPPPLTLAPALLALPLPLPVIHTTPPSPHPSWGACSDADVYSRIGAFRPSRLSSLSSQSKVILFEHSSL